MAPQREWFEKDYYKVLGVSRRRRQGDHGAYRKLSRQSTPTPTLATRGRGAFKEVSAAYDVLGDARSARSTTRSAPRPRRGRGRVHEPGDGGEPWSPR